MRVEKFVNITNIIVDKHSISEQTFDLAKKLDSGIIKVEDLPPVKLIEDKGTFILTDGRHRITAYKLVGIKQIKGRYYERPNDISK